MTSGDPRPPAVILAGGRSSRMGTDKAFLQLGDDTILGHIVSRLQPQVSTIALNAPETFAPAFGLPCVPDGRPGQNGPLDGVLAGLRHTIRHDSAAPFLLSVPCDSPFLPSDLASRLVSQAVSGTIVVASSAGRVHPVFALWPTQIADDLNAWIADPANRRIKAFLDRHHVVTVDFPMIRTAVGELDPFLNVNTPDDLIAAQRFIEVLG